MQFNRIKKIAHIVRMFFTKKQGILVYVGAHSGNNLSSIFRKYEKCYAFEANPELYTLLKIKFNKYPRVCIFNFAVADYDGEIDFNISNNGGASSSIGNFSKDYNASIKMVKTIKVKCIILCSFLQKHKVDFIEDYISDIQGYDLEVLKTLKPYINEKKIKNITCEVGKSKDRQVYSDLPENNKNAFDLFLNDNYEFVAQGWGILTDGKFHQVPETWWDMDCKWKIKG
ncbi:FkbM family methyltransferase [Bathymodiolus septemdierum thioautotrophic gill symbiont]|uniref:Methyltransferase FkbM domain-containing protein n=1 Tax=endosymbiont of Bathymodiolus septemdierum str. Myojin knoll TaxID=1303921 RepID=A0A0P0UR45_9GAMM|nr:FkbM family methyltransferase [Bathymodiolus septemdierum thioautotrophic gill symbiont]BAS67694.1 hypothetical protein BSEPE_0698 [endosymbiont of Bathymodiolus septemdierum str. Myojin knoll]